eukprot:TRINITY_DN668_c1_g1_i1.p1 TRINITY_DN668_c1_g1~~TRINITY_DN668_c1_g1_i1.p1  ORF type:complete len:1386 (-),score=199.98 TRINITY_DN668_c1_g1_i1:292-4449(-)
METAASPRRKSQLRRTRRVLASSSLVDQPGALHDFAIRFFTSTPINIETLQNRILLAMERDKMLAGMLRHERLTHDLLQEITVYRKCVATDGRLGRAASSDRVWRKVGPGLFARWAKNIAIAKRRISCLKAELTCHDVMNLTKAAVAMNAKKELDASAAAEKRGKLIGFWDDYHASQRHQLPTAATRDGVPLMRRDATLDGDSISPERQADFFKILRSAGKGSVDRWRKMMTWKNRGTRDNCTHFGWGRAQSLTEGSVSGEDRGYFKQSQQTADDMLSESSGDSSSQNVPAWMRWRNSRKRRNPIDAPGSSHGSSLFGCSSGMLASPAPPTFSVVLPSLENTAVLPGAVAELFVEPRACGPSCDSATRRYMRACEKHKVMPITMPFIIGQSSQLIARGKSLTDKDLISITAMLPSVKMLEEVDLEGNRLLTDKSLDCFLRTLLDTPASQGLRRLSLSGCSGAGVRTVSSVSRLALSVATEELRCLDLSGIGISMECHRELCKAIGGHVYLASVCLMDTGLGGSMNVAVSKQCVTDLLLGTARLRSLNLGWNRLNAEVLSHLGAQIVEARTVVELSLSNCTAAVKSGNVSPIVSLVEHLARDHLITRLDLSMNHVDYQGALVVEDAFDERRNITFIDVSHNPLGPAGLSSILRLLAGAGNGLKAFEITDCFHGSMPAQKQLVFSPTSPWGRYNLDLSKPYHRAMLRMLYKTCERIGIRAEAALLDIEWSVDPGEALMKRNTKGVYSHPKRLVDGVWPVPSRGRLSVTVSTRKMMEASMLDTQDQSYVDLVQTYDTKMKLKPNFLKIIPLLAAWKDMKYEPNEQAVMRDSLSKDFLLDYPLVDMLCRASVFPARSMEHFLLCMSGRPAEQWLTLLAAPSLKDYAQVCRYLHVFVHFNPENPTGHYKLKLSEAVDFVIATKLLLLNHWESVVSQKQMRPDVSQMGNRSQFRNELYEGRRLSVTNYSEWRLPFAEDFEFDYTCDRRAPQDAHQISDSAFSGVLRVMQLSDCSPREKVESLRRFSHFVYCKAMLVRELIKIFHDREMVMELFVMLFFRILDIHNEKIARCCFQQDEIIYLSQRLGFVAMFPYLQPEQSEVKLNLSYHDQRVAMMILSVLASKETRTNIRNYSLRHSDGSLERLLQGVPKQWAEAFDSIPKAGVFKAEYVCSPETRNFAARKSLLRTYGFWQTKVEHREVNWWMGLRNIPSDVLVFVQYLGKRFTNMTAAFRAIDGPNGNGSISRMELEESVTSMGCKRFKGHDSKQRITTLYRFLDMNCNGHVSIHEFLVLQQLYREIGLCIREFVNFVERAWGDDIQAIWAVVATDDSNDVSFQAWSDFCCDLGFSWHCRELFDFVDYDGRGAISFQEFEVLFTFRSVTDQEMLPPVRR